METIKIWFADFWPEIIFEDIFTPILTKHYNVVLDKINPDVVFFSIFNRMQEIGNYPKAKKILWLAENFKPTQFKSDYSISFEPASDTNFRLPLWQAYLLKQPQLKDRLYNKPNINISDCSSFERFCSFTVSNSSNFVRNSTYSSINQYKRVHSYGRYMTNDFSLQNLSVPNQYWRDIKDKFFIEHKHKFSICYENSSTPFYCTEKLMDSFLGNSLPIYWGDPRAILDFNEESFINVHKYNKLMMNTTDAVKKFDNDNSLYQSMYNQPVFTDSQIINLEENLTKFEYWLLNIIKK